MQRGRPRAQAMTIVTAMPTASHSAAPVSVATLPTTTDNTRLPGPVTALTRTMSPTNSSGGLITTVSRSADAVYRAARTQPATNARPASIGQPNRVAASRPTRKIPAMVSTAPRPVSRGGGAAAWPGRALRD